MHKKLQQILKELTEISGIHFALYSSPEEYVAGTIAEDALSAEQLDRLFESDDCEPADAGIMAFPVRAMRRGS